MLVGGWRASDKGSRALNGVDSSIPRVEVIISSKSLHNGDLKQDLCVSN